MVLRGRLGWPRTCDGFVNQAQKASMRSLTGAGKVLHFPPPLNAAANGHQTPLANTESGETPGDVLIFDK